MVALYPQGRAHPPGSRLRRDRPAVCSSLFVAAYRSVGRPAKLSPGYFLHFVEAAAERPASLRRERLTGPSTRMAETTLRVPAHPRNACARERRRPMEVDARTSSSNSSRLRFLLLSSALLLYSSDSVRNCETSSASSAERRGVEQVPGQRARIFAHAGKAERARGKSSLNA